MATENGSSTMEMGTSDQDLVTPKRKKKLTYIIGTIAFLAVIGVVVALVVVLSGDNQAGDAEAIVSTTEGPTSPGSTTTSTTTTTTTTTTTESPTDAPTDTPTDTPTDSPTIPTELPPVTQPPPTEIDLEEIINGVFAPAGFNGTWTADGEILFRNGDGHLVMYNVDSNDTTLLVQNTSEILQQASRVTQLSPDQTHVVLSRNVAPIYRYSFLAQYSAINIASGDIVDITPPGVNSSVAFLQNFVWGPSGTSLAFVYLNNVFYQSSLTAEPQQISTSGQINVVYHGIPDWVYEEEVFTSNNALWFSSDGNKLAYASFDDSNVRVMRVPHYGVPGSVNFQYTQHHEIRYPKPGTTNPTVYVTLRDVATGTANMYDAPSDIQQPILKTVKFVTNETIALVWTNRVQNQLRVALCTQPQTVCNTIFEYNEPEGWIDNIPFHFNAQGNAFITILPFLVNDSTRYKQVVQVTEGTAASWTLTGRSNTPHTVLEILQWTADDTIWYKATRETDSSEQHIYNVNSAGQVSCYTCELAQEGREPCLYNDGAISQDAAKITINCGGPGVPHVSVYNINGTLIHVWDDNAETSQLLSEKELPEVIRLSVPVADGYPDADVEIQVPSNYETRTNVPLLVYVYGGPDTALVTKQWSIDWGTSLVTRWGIAVAHIDGRGSGLRGVNNAFAVNRRLGTVEIEDQINVTRFLHQNLTWLDSNRTCIWGWSYGGYASSLALARGNDVFRCAAAVAPVADWRFYDTIYTERYMDVPQDNTDAYAQSSLLTDEVAEAFRNKRYFLIHGTADDNVHYQHSMLISRLLQRRDVYFQQMSYTDEQHGLSGVTPHLYHALERFLQENML